MSTEKYYTYVYLDPRKSGDFTYQRGIDEIYCFNYKLIYVGKGSKNRIEYHTKKSLETDENKLFYNVIRKIYESGLEPIRFKILQNVTEEEAFAEEINLISIAGRRDKGLGSLCNETDGGDGIKGYIRERIDLTNQTFGRLKVVGFVELDKWGASKWNCLCDCGSELSVGLTPLRLGTTKSCGCLQKELVRERATKYKKHNSSIRNTWKNIYQCCYNPKNKRHSSIGNRGIKMCDRWLDFGNFLDDVEERPSDNYIFGRIDTSEDYEPSNCKWMTRKEEGQNRREREELNTPPSCC